MHGFHGASSRLATQISEHGNWRDSYISNVLGRGVYFFIDANEKIACLHARQHPFCDIGECDIRAIKALLKLSPKEHLIDLNDQEWIAKLEDFKNTLKRRSEYRNDEHLTSVAIDWLCEWLNLTYKTSVCVVKQTLVLQNPYLGSYTAQESAVCACVRWTHVIKNPTIINS